MINKSYYGSFNYSRRLNPGSMDKEYIRLLIDISKIRSDKVANALTDYFVLGESRASVCEKHNVNQGYLSLKIKEIQSVSDKVHNAFLYYI
ncbi:TPA: hypothetical protein U5E30_001029 [Yersinia enterocolitica]|nr:hypothetical protein [Yersinia enterocolitica]